MILTSKARLFATTWLILTALLIIGVVPAAAQTSLDIERIQRATVLVMQTRIIGNSPIITCVGSGTIVSRDGLILTNAHHSLSGANCSGDTLIISLNIRPGEPPVARYQAEVVQANPGLDLALLRITRQVDGRLIDRASLALPFVEIGDSASVGLDDTITVVGYPGIGNDPIVFERGTISGFAAEPSGGDRSWIKTSASITGTMSGGGAYNQNGLLIGIPTTAPLTPNPATGNCISVQDSNADGLINTNDVCIPTGGFINLLRPSAFVRPLLQAAQLDITISFPLERVVSATATTAAARPRFRYLGFSPSVNPAGMPTTIIRSLPTGSNSLYLFFDYENMTPETVYELRVNTNGIPNPNFSVSPVRWSGGSRGLWYVGSSGQPFPNGNYEFTLFIDGIAGDSARLVIGGGPDEGAAFSDIVFGLLDGAGNVTGTGFVLPTGNTASARFLYRNMTPGGSWAAIWYYEGQEVQRTDDGTVWAESDGASGTKTISIQSVNGLLPGSYRLELYIEGRLAAVSDFTLAGGQDGSFARIFNNTHFTTASSVQEALSAAPISSFSAGTSPIFAMFNWQLIGSGTLWRIDWSVDNQLFFSQTQPWSGAPTGSNFLMQLASPTGLPDGTYRLDLFVGEIQFDTAQFRVGIGQLPIDRFASAEGIALRGQVLNSVSRDGIQGVSVMLISEDYSVADFTRDWNQAQLIATATTDRNGRFEVTVPLQRGALYSIVLLAEGFLPITADGVEITDENHPDNSPIDITLELTPE